MKKPCNIPGINRITYFLSEKLLYIFTRQKFFHWKKLNPIIHWNPCLVTDGLCFLDNPGLNCEVFHWICLLSFDTFCNCHHTDTTTDSDISTYLQLLTGNVVERLKWIQGMRCQLHLPSDPRCWETSTLLDDFTVGLRALCKSGVAAEAVSPIKTAENWKIQTQIYEFDFLLH